MDENRTEFVDKTVLNTPKPTACSTIDRRSLQRKKFPADLENSLGLLPSPAADVSNILDQDRNNSADISYQLQQQHILASSSLQRANKVTSIPSRYLKPNINMSSTNNLNLTTESTINESDLLKTPKDTSTPRSSVTSNSFDENLNDPPRLSLGQSMAEFSYKIGNTDISIDNFVKEFQKAMKSLDQGVDREVDRDMFKPAEEAASMLLADELSWRRKNDIPITKSFSQIVSDDVSLGKMSVGAFFQQRSDTLSDFQAAVSPEKKNQPVPLIDSSVRLSQESEAIINTCEVNANNKSLSISAIQKFLATEDTPRKVTNYLLFQGNKLEDKESERKINDNDSLLPVSKDSSFTSNYSDNDAMKCIIADKENIQYNEQQINSESVKPSKSENRPSSTSSQTTSRTSSSLTSLQNGKLPIESTKCELIWGCVKVDRCITQDFLIRNRTSKRLGLQMSISGHEFKIRKDCRQESEPMSAAKVILHPHESRPVHISFIPTKIGAAIDELLFTSLDPNLQQTKKQCVRLYGYGGYGKIDMYNLTKDTTGKFWLSLGKLDDRNTITARFLVKNIGTLPTFAYISFNSKDLIAFANVSVSPNFLVLIPNEQKEVTITYIPTAEDHKISQQSFFTSTLVADIGALLIISGTEVNRGRLRRICRKCTEKGLVVDPVSNVLKETVKNEVMPPDMILFKESPNAIKDILKLFTRNEIVLTLEQDPEQTIMPQYPDESALFQSLCQDNTMIGLENTRVEASCKLEPATIILTPPTKIKDSLFLISETDKALHFEVVCNPEGLEISPKDGIIRPRQELILNLSYPQTLTTEKKLFKVFVYVENEVFETSVKITFIHSQALMYKKK